ncbi:hypothetical protein CS562_31650 [Paenibacillus sp. LK1]|nr:hypothetical protein CS562_31650 [Paenibacillus sp. LK1]
MKNWFFSSVRISSVPEWKPQGIEVKKLAYLLGMKVRNGTSVEGQEHSPIEVANLAAFLIYRYKFVSRAKDKNLYRLPEWTRT